MNSFGTNFRVQVFGESHGPVVGVVIDGVAPGISLVAEDLKADIDRRRGGTGAGTTPRAEADLPKFISGVFNNKTTGAPLTIIFENENARPQDYEAQRAIPRPGHADLTAAQKFQGFNDPRGGGHFSGRLTLCLVAAGAVAKKQIAIDHPAVTFHAELAELGGQADVSKGLEKALAANDSVGGIVECRISNLPPALGEPFFNSVESMIAHAAFSIPAIKGIEFGSGFSAAKMYGSAHNDAITDEKGTTATNNAGGISGGLTNGNELVFRLAVKPASSTPQQQESFNKDSKRMEKFSIGGRHDLAIALRVPVVAEAIAAIVICDLLKTAHLRS